MLSFKTGRTPLGRYCLSGQILAGWIKHIKLFWVWTAGGCRREGDISDRDLFSFQLTASGVNGGTVLRTSLDHTKEAALQLALAGVQACKTVLG